MVTWVWGEEMRGRKEGNSGAPGGLTECSRCSLSCYDGRFMGMHVCGNLQMMYSEYVHFVLCQWYLNEVIFKSSSTMKRHRGILNVYHQVKETNLQRLYAL